MAEANRSLHSSPPQIHELKCVFDVLDSQATAVLDGIDGLLETLRDKAAHPQEFGMDGCPACKVQDLLGEASLVVQEASVRIREWQPEAKTV